MMGKSQHKATPQDSVSIPGPFVPSFRLMMALENEAEKNLLISTWGGLGDQICSEPTLRYAVKSFTDCKVSLFTELPELFSHIKFENVFNKKTDKPELSKFYNFETAIPTNTLTSEFFSHGLTNCVDFPAMCAFRMQLPIADRQIYLTSKDPGGISDFSKYIFVHAGKHWPSKTFPKVWWNGVLSEIKNAHKIPVLIGSDFDHGRRGTVSVDVNGCMDLRNKLTIQETAFLLQRAKHLITNDSSPLHMAASTDPSNPEGTGHAWVHCLATCKRPDYIFHWRKGVWNYREINHALGGIYDSQHECPNRKLSEEVRMDMATDEQLNMWLPKPKTLIERVMTC